ncbi:glycosyltransferase family 4 protein [Actinorugispora endophytica]|uniref:Phosphatidylinositol alpha-1,6-mannosyltransferase n=1 Tax=Actinorugispora endophytica TaxID=1605990 RepID=A0A4R6UFZ9_9ACTN|nr:glycosyltransferase family 4 protein [Actinorugispora endophytica]TDQ45721.1 phosphatidylinositol alpha-1,6-mannosyltransferase [Actinorugispora endophytica]
MARRTLLVTNDFPPRRGGIETFCYELAARMAQQGEGVVYTSRSPGDRGFDAGLDFPVMRDRAATLLPTRRVTERAATLMREYGCDRVLFGAAAPLALAARRLRRAGAGRIVAITHGHEVWWSRLPGSRVLLRRIGADVDVLTYLGSFTRSELERAVAPADRGKLVRFTPGVDPALFHPGVDGSAVRGRYGLGDAPVVLCAARLVPRKGVDALVRAMTWVRMRVPGARLLVVGDGPDGKRLRELAEWAGVGREVVFAGGHPHAELPAFFAAADVFAMPSRTCRAGLEAEGLGIVYLEAAATGLPVVVGDSGGAPDTVRHGRTGFVVDGRDPKAVAGRLSTLLADPALARAMGARGRERVLAEWTWDSSARRLADLLA